MLRSRENIFNAEALKKKTLKKKILILFIVLRLLMDHSMANGSLNCEWITQKTT
jgi:hypothetical protein